MEVLTQGDIKVKLIRISDLREEGHETSYLHELSDIEAEFVMHSLGCDGCMTAKEVVEGLLVRGNKKIKDDGRTCVAEILVY